MDALTQRELEILALLAEGFANAEIAQQLTLGLETIKWYNRQIYSKLGVRNRTEAVTTARARGLLSIAAAGSDIAAPPLHNLPAPTTPFIGRQQELDRLTEWLMATPYRLITVVGPGGTGKTRLATEAARRLLSAYPQGVFYVPLVAVHDLAGLYQALAAAVGYEQQQDNRSLAEQLAAYLGPKQLLLLLDNFEQLIPSAPQLNLLLQQAPAVKLLVTSRQKLNLQTEYYFPLGGLSFPTTVTADLEDSDAVRLFTANAQRIQPGFVLKAADQAAVLTICRLLDGLPLALLLASGWVNLLSPAEIAAEIAADLDFLQAQSGDLPARQQSIRLIFEHTWERLPEKTRHCYSQLAVFAAGFDYAAAQAVSGCRLAELQQLINCALLGRVAETGRYELHELLRQFAVEQLQQSGELTAVRDRHSHYFLTRLAELEVSLKGAGQRQALSTIGANFANYQTAWSWACQQGDFVGLANALEALEWFRLFGNKMQEGEQLFQLALTALRSAPQADPWLLHNKIAVRLGQLAPAQALAEQDPTHAEPQEQAYLRWQIGRHAMGRLEFADAIIHLSAAVDQFIAQGNKFYHARVLNNLAYAYLNDNEYDRARQLCQQALQLRQEIGDEIGISDTLVELGTIAITSGRYSEAEQHFQEAIAIRQGMATRESISWGLGEEAFMEFLRGNFAAARRIGQQAVDIAQDIQSDRAKGYSWSILSWLASMAEEYEEALALARAALPLNIARPTVTNMADWAMLLAAAGLPDYGLAQHHLQLALAFASQRELYLYALNYTPVAAVLLHQQGDSAKAAEVLACSLTGPEFSNIWKEEWPLLQRLKADLAAELGAERYTHHWQQGQKLAAADLMAWLLGHFGS